MPKAKLEMTEEMQDFIERRIDEAKSDILNKRKKAMVEASAAPDEKVVHVGSFADDAALRIAEILHEEYDNVPESRIQEIHVEVGGQITVRYYDGDWPGGDE